MKKSSNREVKILITLLVIFILLFILIVSITRTISTKRSIPTLMIHKTDLALRGDIISSDKFKIATSKRIFTASIDSRSLDLDKLDLFVKLFSIYSSIKEEKLKNIIKKAIKKKKYFLILDTKISSRDAKNLKLLAYKLRRLKVFKPIYINGTRRLFGLDLYETGEQRLYPYEKVLTPFVGYIRKRNNSNKKIRVNGEKGLERYYNNKLNNLKNGLLKGERDIYSYIIFNKNSTLRTPKNGDILHLNISLKFQRTVEMILDRYKKKLGAKEIIACVMDSKTGKILSIATSNRFNPSSIHQNDIEYLTVKAIEQTFEPGSVIKPILLSLALDKYKVTTNDLISAHNFTKRDKKGLFKHGKMKIGRWTIKDDHQFKKNYLTIRDIIIHSSNIGILQIAQRLKAKEIVDGYKSFGFLKKTGIDLPFEKVGSMPTINQLSAGESKKKNNVFKATVSYGQGMRTSFIQLIKAYSVFNNNGIIVTPQILQRTMINKGEQVISSKSANKIKEYLIATVQEGTGFKTKIDGLQIGGKTGTAQKARGGGYKRRYISSFFGFANDKNNRYTIGVSVNEPIAFGKHWYYYYASESAVPVFKEIIKTMIKIGYLQPKINN